MRIKPYFKTELAEPYQGKHFHDVGASVIMNMEVKTKTLGNFLVMLPDPVSLNLNNAQGAINKSESLKERINSAKQFTVFSKTLTESEISGLKPEEIKALDPEANILRSLNEEKVFEYIQTSMGLVVSLITAIESFVNLIIPHDYTFDKINSTGEVKTLNKEEIIRKCSIEDKLEIVTKVKGKMDLKQQAYWKTFKEIKDLRDEIIHFKKMGNKIDEMWNPIVIYLFDSELQKLLSDTVALISYLHPTYLEIDY